MDSILSTLAFIAVILVLVIAYRILRWLAYLYIALTENMPIWGHLIIVLIAPFMIVVVIMAIIIIGTSDVDDVF